MPTVLFVWGPGRIVPVRVTNLTITEKLYDALLLNPIHAEATIEIQVLTPEEVSKAERLTQESCHGGLRLFAGLPAGDGAGQPGQCTASRRSACCRLDEPGLMDGFRGGKACFFRVPDTPI